MDSNATDYKVTKRSLNNSIKLLCRVMPQREKSPNTETITYETVYL